jgi:hypothetical protein
MAYGETDRLTGGTPTADSAYSSTNTPDYAVDNNTETGWTSASGFPHWWKYDFGAGTAWAIGKLRWYSTDAYGPNAFTVNGSNNDSDWTELYSGNGTKVGTDWQETTWENSTTYRYIKINITSGWDADSVAIREFEAFEQLAVSGGILNWWFFKEAWQKHDKIWQPKLAIPNGYTM